MSKKKQTKENLKPCPFCGDNAIIYRKTRKSYMVACSACFCCLNYPFKEIKTAGKAWNDRV